MVNAIILVDNKVKINETTAACVFSKSPNHMYSVQHYIYIVLMQNQDITLSIKLLVMINISSIDSTLIMSKRQTCIVGLKNQVTGETKAYFFLLKFCHPLYRALLHSIITKIIRCWSCKDLDLWMHYGNTSNIICITKKERKQTNVSISPPTIPDLKTQIYNRGRWQSQSGRWLMINLNVTGVQIKQRQFIANL